MATCAEFGEEFLQIGSTVITAVVNNKVRMG